MTLAQMRTALQARGYATDTATSQTEAINTRYRALAGKRRWPWLEAQNATLVTVANNAVVSTAAITDLLWIDAVRIESTTEFWELEYLSPQEFRELEHRDRDGQRPANWTQINGTLRLWPRPDRVYTVTVDYLKDPPDLSADGDTPLFAATYHDLLVWGAIIDIAFRERDMQGVEFAGRQYQDLERRMESEYGVRERQNATHVRRSSFWASTGWS